MAHSRVPLRSHTAVGPSQKGEQACVVHLPGPSHRLNLMICIETRRPLMFNIEMRITFMPRLLMFDLINIEMGPGFKTLRIQVMFRETGIVLPLLIVDINISKSRSY
jgi:hypothetical protein